MSRQHKGALLLYGINYRLMGLGMELEALAKEHAPLPACLHDLCDICKSFRFPQDSRIITLTLIGIDALLQHNQEIRLCAMSLREVMKRSAYLKGNVINDVILKKNSNDKPQAVAVAALCEGCIFIIPVIDVYIPMEAIVDMAVSMGEKARAHTVYLPGVSCEMASAHGLVADKPHEWILPGAKKRLKLIEEIMEGPALSAGLSKSCAKKKRRRDQRSRAAKRLQRAARDFLRHRRALHAIATAVRTWKNRRDDRAVTECRTRSAHRLQTYWKQFTMQVIQVDECNVRLGSSRMLERFLAELGHLVWASNSSILKTRDVTIVSGGDSIHLKLPRDNSASYMIRRLLRLYISRTADVDFRWKAASILRCAPLYGAV